LQNRKRTVKSIAKPFAKNICRNKKTKKTKGKPWE
jgi:hypothetical protein